MNKFILNLISVSKKKMLIILNIKAKLNQFFEQLQQEIKASI